MKPIEITDDNFEMEVIKSPIPILVDFWASWCGPCRVLAPIIEKLGEKYQGKFQVGKLDVDKNPMAVATFGIKTIPILMLFQNGDVTGQVIGAAPEKEIMDMLSMRIKDLGK